jgi:hypothetical protein
MYQFLKLMGGGGGRYDGDDGDDDDGDKTGNGLRGFWFS